MYEDNEVVNLENDAAHVESVTSDDPATSQLADQDNPLTAIQTAENEISHLKDQLLRALAETDNIRRRAEREKEDTSRYAITKFARDLLAVSDNLSRALDTLDQTESNQVEFINNFTEGIKLTERELNNTFERFGVKKIAPLGEKFDHNFHQAMMEIESSDNEPGVILQVLQVGYTLHDRLLRPAMVGVAKAAS